MLIGISTIYRQKQKHRVVHLLIQLKLINIFHVFSGTAQDSNTKSW